MTKNKKASMGLKKDLCTRVLRIEPYLVPGMFYAAEEVVGWKYWAKLTEHQRGLAERCLADLVLRGLLPLKLNGQISAYPILVLGIEEESQQVVTIEVSRPEGAHDE